MTACWHDVKDRHISPLEGFGLPVHPDTLVHGDLPVLGDRDHVLEGVGLGLLVGVTRLDHLAVARHQEGT